MGAAATTVSEQNLELVRTTVEAWNRGDRSAWAESLDPDIVWAALPDNPDYLEPVRGRAAVLDLIDEWLEPWSRYEIETIELEPTGDTVVWTARHMAVPDHTGVTLEAFMSAALTFRDGRIAQARFFPARAQAHRRDALRHDWARASGDARP